MNLADEYGLPLHELLARWTSRELSQLMVLRKMKQDHEAEALNPKPKEQDPEDMLAFLDGIAARG